MELRSFPLPKGTGRLKAMRLALAWLAARVREDEMGARHLTKAMNEELRTSQVMTGYAYAGMALACVLRESDAHDLPILMQSFIARIELAEYEEE